MRATVRLPLAADYWLLTGVLGVLLLLTLRSPAIGLHGEAREALVVRDVVEHGNWILPHRIDKLPSKPPLYHWIAAVAVSQFGSSDAIVRLPSALAAVLMAYTVYAFGVAVGGRATGWLSIGALFGMLGFWQFACEARVDMLFAASISLALTGFFVWYQERSTPHGAHRWGRVLFYLGCACAVLSKGPAGIVLPCLVVLGFLCWQRDLAVVFQLWSWTLVASVLVIDAGWYWLAYRAGGDAFVATQLLHENLDRFVGSGAFARSTRRHSAWRLERTLVTEFFPWNLAILDGARRAWKGDGPDAADRFLHAWWLVVLLVFTVAAGQRPVYLLPIAPAIAVLAGRTLLRLVESRSGVLALHLPRFTRWKVRPLVAVGLLLVAVDAAAFAGSVVSRHFEARRRSLASFAEEVSRRVPREAPLYASPGLRDIDIMVLTYRLERVIERRRPGCGAEYVVVPDSALASLAERGVRVVVSSGRPKAAVSLVREPDASQCGATS